MAKDRSKRTIKRLSKEKFIGNAESQPVAMDFFKSLSVDEQDDILRMIITEGGLDRLISVVQSTDTPGAIDLLLDQVQYYHFLRTVVEGHNTD